ncbi:2-C-methyl-D-erythritol 4-phosphate cytidylyltransferase [Proteinivorax tanatarense]|uniref:2-C-methyl-D-erythritol 4-phosphate cytidylyltransferase n=1 Tax=Proteinivorax tanatarense TaxID=1260629 RepID=A0AAU7VLU9_9FIRM
MGNVIALIAAAGSGSRMKINTKKQYLNLAGQPMLARTVLLFQKNKNIDKIYVLCPLADMKFCQQVIKNHCGQFKIAGIIPGGDTRFDSIYNGISKCEIEDTDKVLIHDGARPFASQAIINNIINKLSQKGVNGVVPGIPVKDTIKKIDGDLIVDSPPRKQLIAAQTPQGFCAKVLKELYKMAKKDNVNNLTDDSSLLEHYGYPMHHILGEENNFKVTTPQDLELAQLYLKEGEK